MRFYRSIQFETMKQSTLLNKEQINKSSLNKFPAKCKMYLTLLLSIGQEKVYNSIPKIIRKNYECFTTSFKKLDESQRNYFIRKNIDYVQAKLVEKDQAQAPKIFEIETSCQIKSTFMKMTFWEKRTLRYEYFLSRVKLSTSKKQDLVDLKSYLVRKSKSEKNAIVLQAFDSSINQKLQKISIKFPNNSIFQEIYVSLRQSIVDLSLKRIECLLIDDLQENNDLQIMENKESIDLTIITSKNINQFFEKKQQFINKLKTGKKQLFSVYNQGNLKIFKSSISSKLYYIQYLLPKEWHNMSIIQDKINILRENSNRSEFSCEKLEKFNESISANYYKINYDHSQYQLVMIVQKIQKSNGHQQIMKSASSIFFGIDVPFIEVNLTKNKSQTHYLQINCIVKKRHKLTNTQNKKIIINFLLSLVKGSMESIPYTKHGISQSLKSPKVQRKNQQENDISSPLKSNPIISRESRFQQSMNASPLKVINEDTLNQENYSFSDEKDEEFYSIQNVQEIQELPQFQQICSKMSATFKTQQYQQCYERKQRQLKSNNPNHYLKAKYSFVPTEKGPKKVVQYHKLVRDWRKSSKGGVICNQIQVIQESKKFIKLVLTQLGSSIFKMKGISNFSLPIQICGNQSVLVNFARSISFAPLLLQNLSNQTLPIERMKKLVILHLSWSSLTIASQKPFNPILGETYQGDIDGCPIYLQQISHHPPCSYLYLHGRGYKIYGVVCPNLSLRLNSAVGACDQLLSVEFENGDLCKFSLGVMVANGTIFGETSLFYQGVSLVIDKKNNLVAQITYNSKNKNLGIFKSKDNNDLLTVNIYEVTYQYIQKAFKVNQIIPLKKQDKIRLIQSMNGEWNGPIFNNGKQIYDFMKEAPLQLHDFSHPLPSDCSYRQDIRYRVIGDMAKGQQEKQRLQQIQRNDRKLRAKYKEASKKD